MRGKDFSYRVEKELLWKMVQQEKENNFSSGWILGEKTHKVEGFGCHCEFDTVSCQILKDFSNEIRSSINKCSVLNNV